MTDIYNSRRINILRDSVARRIAAGEVIDRPQAVVRELLDNSIDAGSSEINLYIHGGGIEEIRVVDNGSGMDEENLQKCFLPHATSKITDFEDIYSTKSLGFRGEALSSIAACSRLSITSSVSDDGSAFKLEIQDGKLRDLSPFRGPRGTLISVRDLFYSMPGRRNFLKSPSAESALCRTTFIEKALPQLETGFRYFAEDKLKLFLPASDLKTRIVSAFGGLFHQNFIDTFSAETDGISITAAAGTPSLYRKDRKYIQIFINNRRISDFALVQAVDYAYSSFLPGGCHPVGFLFLDIPPEHVDFNIHPAKREVKFRNLPEIHHIVTDTLGSYLGKHNSFRVSAPLTGKQFYSEKQKSLDIGRPAAAVTSAAFPSSPAKDSIFRKQTLEEISSEISSEIAAEAAPVIKKGNITEPSRSPHPAAPGAPLVYLGQLFNLFLLFEHGDTLLLIDQHAAHERIIFDRLSEEKPQVQELLVPVIFCVESAREHFLLNSIEQFKQMGFDLQQADDGEWMLNSMPSICSGMEDELTAFFSRGIKNISELKKELYAMMSCRSAIRDGDSISSITALELAGAVLKLENPRCPHGRPVIQQITREQLFRMFGRTF